MVGATDFFFTILIFGALTISILSLIGAMINKVCDWWYERGLNKSRIWLLEEFDRQASGLLELVAESEELAREHNLELDPADEDLKVELAHLRWSLEASRYFFSDLERFRKNGAPILLVLDTADARPRLLLGISAVGMEVALSEGSILPKRKARLRLNSQAIECLRDSYPNLSGTVFSMVYSLYRENDEKRIDQYSEEERRLY